MAELTQRLSKIAVLLAKIEPTPGDTTLALSPTADALEVSEPNWNPDIQLVERDYVAGDLAPFAALAGQARPSMTFTTELKSNGRAQSGNPADAPMIARLLQACGYQLLGMSAPADQVIGPIAGFDNKSAPAFAVAGPITLTSPVLYTVQVTTPGASGAAKVRVYSNDPLVDPTNGDAEITVTTGTALNLGTSGAKLTPTFAGNLSLGDRWRVLVLPVGLKLKPLSGSAVKTIALHLYKDGVLHKMPAARGTFRITSAAGDIARVEFTFQGGYVTPVDAATPATTFADGTLPQLVELSNLTWGRQRDLVAQQWTYDQANTVSPRADVNADQGIKGYRITDRSPTGGFNPEATLEAEMPFWGELERGVLSSFFAKVGSVVGNTCVVFLPQAQLTGLPYGDREGSLIYDATMRANRWKGDDETFFFFC